MTPRQSLALCLLLMTSACLGPRPSAPVGAAVAPPDAWREGSGTAELDDIHWWERFGDPTLNKLVEQAVSRNANIGEAAARVAEARANMHAARAARLPEIDGISAGDYSRTVTLGIPVTTAEGESEATVAWDLDLFGRLAKADAAARAGLLATQASRDAVRLAITSTTAETYIRLLGADARLQIATATLATREASVTLQRRLASAGYSSRLDELQAEAEYRSTQALVPQAQLVVTQLENALSILVGDPPGSIVRPANGLDRLVQPVIPIGLPSALLRRRPDVASAEDYVVAADHSLDSARAAMLPDIALSGSAGELYAHVLPHPFSIFDIGGSILAPLFDGGRRRSAADAAAARRDQAAFAYRDTVLTALRESGDAIASVRRTAEQRDALVRQTTAEAAALNVAIKRYAAGYESFLEQLDTQRRLLSAQLDLAGARTDEFVACTQLYRALGGGWESPTAGADAAARKGS